MLALAGDWPEQPAINAATRLAAKPQVSSASDHSEQASLASLDSADAQEVRASICTCPVTAFTLHSGRAVLCWASFLVTSAAFPSQWLAGAPTFCRLCSSGESFRSHTDHGFDGRGSHSYRCNQVAWPVTKLEAAPSLRLLPETSAAAVDLLTMSVRVEAKPAAVRAAGSGCGAVPDPVQLWRLDTAAPAAMPCLVRTAGQPRLLGGRYVSLLSSYWKGCPAPVRNDVLQETKSPIVSFGCKDVHLQQSYVPRLLLRRTTASILQQAG